MSTVCQFKELLEALHDSKSRVVIIGGLAAIANGSTTSTSDLDVCYMRDDANYAALATLLVKIQAYPRGAPPGLPFKMDARTLKSGLNFTFNTNLGPFDLLGEMEGVGTYEDAVSDARKKTIFGVTMDFISLPKLIAAKRAAGRPKDIAILQELETLSEIEKRSKSGD